MRHLGVAFLRDPLIGREKFRERDESIGGERVQLA